MKIARTIESFYPYMSGPANQAFRISSELEKRGIKSSILTSEYKAKRRPKREKIEGVTVNRFPIKWKFMKYFYTPKMKEKLKGFDVYASHSYRSYQTELAYKTAKKKGKPFVLHNHGSLIGYKSFVKGWKKIPYLVYDLFHKNVALKADAVVVNTKQEYREVVRFGVNRKKIHIIPFGIDAERYKPMTKNKKVLTLLWVGRVTKDRNIEVILKALKLLEKEKVRLRVVGNEYKRTSGDKESELKRLKQIVKRLGIKDKVEFIPWTKERANKEFRKADIFVYTSLWENLGQTILEAAAAGLPLICTKVGVALDLVEKGKTGYLVRKDNPKMIAKAVRQFLSSEKRKKSEKLLRKRVKEEYNWKGIMEKYVRLYKKLAGDSSSR